MIDIHCHLIPSIDDGSRTMDETIKMLKEATEAGFTDIVLTPHFMEGVFETEVNLINSYKNQMQEIANNNGINIKLYTGNEVYIQEDIDVVLKNNKAVTLNGSNYLLMELPLNSNVRCVNSVIFKLKSMHIIPIIAHPERYSFVQDDIEYVQDLIDQGCLIQCNYASAIGKYGRKAEKTIKVLLKNNLVHFLGSDCHRPNTIYTDMKGIIKKIKKVTTEEQFNKITEENARKIILQ